MPAAQQIDGLRKEPVSEAGEKVVIVAMGLATVWATDSEIVTFVNFRNQFRNAFEKTIGADRQNNVADNHRRYFDIGETNASALLHVNWVPIVSAPFDCPVCGVTVQNQDSVMPRRLDLGWDNLNSINLVQDKC